MEMFSLDTLFAQIFPWMTGISWDLGTILTGLVFLWFLILGFDWVKEMLLGNWERNQSSKWADRYSSAAEEAFMARNTNRRGSAAWQEQDMVYRKFISKAADQRIKGWKY